MSLKFNGTEIMEVTFDGIKLTEIILDGIKVWNSYLRYTLLDDGTYSVYPRTTIVEGSGTVSDTYEPDGYLCSFDISLADEGLDNSLGTLSATVSSYLGFISTPTVSVSATAIHVSGYSKVGGGANLKPRCSATLAVVNLPQKLIIPSEYDGKVITRIESGAFKGCTQLKELRIPNSVTSYGNALLEGCTNLETLWLPYMDGDLSYLFDSEYEPTSVPKSLTSVIITGTSIPNFAFEDYTDLKKVYIASSVSTIGQYAFYGCTNLTIYCEVASKQSGWHRTWNALSGDETVPTVYSTPIPD